MSVTATTSPRTNTGERESVSRAPTMEGLTELEQRFLEEEEALRGLSPIDGAFGRDASDYHNMWNLFTQIIQRAGALNEDPNAFLGDDGKTLNDKALNAWTRMIATARAILEGLNKMRNNDKMVGQLLEGHTRAFTQACCIDLGVEVNKIIAGVNAGDTSETVSTNLKRFIRKRVPEIFLESARGTLLESNKSYGLPT